MFNALKSSLTAILILGFISGCGGGGSGSADSSSESSMSMSLLAGVPSKVGNRDGTGANAMFNSPYGSVVVGSNLYVADSYNNLIRKIVISTGVVTTFAGNGEAATVDGTGTSASFNSPTGIASDGTNLYVTEWSGKVVRKIVIATRVVTTIAGNPGVEGTVDGTGAAAEFSIPTGITTDGTNLYVVDMWIHKIRKVVISSGVVTTFAGDGTCGSTDATGAAASFCQPMGITNDGTNLYVADSGNQIIRQIDMTTGIVTTLAGQNGVTGSADGVGSSAQFNYPEGIVEVAGHLYIVDTQNYIVRDLVISSGAVSTLAGTAGLTGYADGVSSAVRFAINPGSLSSDGTNLYISDTSNATIRKIVISTATSTTLAGTAALSSVGSTDGTRSAARFNAVQGLATDGTNLYATDFYNFTIRKVVIATGATTTLAGTAGVQGNSDGTGAAASFGAPYGLAYVGGNLYVADYNNHIIRKIVVSTGVVTTFAGSGVNGHADGVGTAAQFSYPAALTTDGTYLYVAGGGYIQKVRLSDADVTSLAGDGSYAYADGTGSAATFGWIMGMTVLGNDLYLVDGEFNNVRKIVISTGVTTTLAGSSGAAGSTDGAFASARFFAPSGIGVASNNSLYVSDQGNNSIRKLNLSSGMVTTIVGNPSSRFDQEGPVATTAAIAHPYCMLVDSSVGIFLGSDSNIQRIR